MLPALAVIRPVWSSVDERWRADKPMRPWFRGPAPCAAALALGAISLDLTAAGLGVPEIFPTHTPLHHQDAAHAHPDRADAAGPMVERSFGAWSSEHAAEAALTETAPWAQHDFIAPSWERAHEHSHDWWA